MKSTLLINIGMSIFIEIKNAKEVVICQNT